MSFPPYQAIDREAIWAALYTHLKSQLWAAPWQADTPVTAGTVIADKYGHLQKAQNDGTTGTDEPQFSQAGGATTDNTVTWQDTGAGVVSIGRKHKAPPALGIAEQPALFVVQIMQGQERKYANLPAKLTLHGYLILYLISDAPNEGIGAEQLLAATQLNDLYKAIDTALLPDDPTKMKFTIGGLVEHCWIEGETREDPGILGNQAAAIMPLHILVP